MTDPTKTPDPEPEAPETPPPAPSDDQGEEAQRGPVTGGPECPICGERGNHQH